MGRGIMLLKALVDTAASTTLAVGPRPAEIYPRRDTRGTTNRERNEYDAGES